MNLSMATNREEPRDGSPVAIQLEIPAHRGHTAQTHRRAKALLTPLLLVVGSSALLPAMTHAADPLTDGRRLARAGKLEAAEKRLRGALGGPTHNEALLLLSDVLLRRGLIRDAEKLASELAERPNAPPEVGLVLARALRRQGQHRGAVDALREVLRRDPEAHLARARLGDLLIYVGDQKGARRVLEPMLAADDLSVYRQAGDLVAVGIAARLLGHTRFAFQAFDDATVRDPQHLAAQVELGFTALEKYDTIHAEQGFRAALKIDEKEARAHVGLAMVELQVARDYDKAASHIERALERDPALPEALRLRAQLLIEDEQSQKALQVLAEVLSQNPRDVQALALKAAAYNELGDKKRFAKTLRAAQRVRPQHGVVYTTAARIAARHHRYEEAVRLAKRALKVEPDHWPAQLLLGIEYTRTGQEDLGRRHLERYYEHDDYNVRVTNLLNLYERWLGDYGWLKSGPLQLRIHRLERTVGKRVVLPFLRDTLRRYDKRYRWKPKRPVRVEIFHRPDLFALRSVGLPGVGSHGICFGRLVTARSPSSGDFNWGMVLAHELAHVYGLGISKHRVPRWFTEGLAEYETNVTRPEWTRQHGQALFNALQSGRLPPIEDLSRSFTRAGSVGEIVVAYQHSALVVHYLVEIAGYQAVRGALKRFGRGEQLGTVLKAVTGLSLRALDTRLSLWLRKRLSGYASNWDLDELRYRDPKPLRDHIQEAPEDPEAWASLAAHHLGAQRPAQALESALKALKYSSTTPVALFVAAKALTLLKRGDEAIPHLEAMLQAGHDGYRIRRLLAQLEMDAKRWDNATKHLQQAAGLEPERASPHMALARIMIGRGDRGQAMAHLEKAAMRSANDPEPSRLLARWSLDQGNGPDALRWAEQLRFIVPFEANTHMLHGDALALNRQDKQAIDAYRLARDLEPSNALGPARLAGALLRLGDTQGALEAAQQALNLDPEQAEARKVVETIKATR